MNYLRDQRYMFQSWFHTFTKDIHEAHDRGKLRTEPASQLEARPEWPHRCPLGALEPQPCSPECRQTESWEGCSEADQKSMSEGLGQLSLGPGTELAALLNRTKAKEEWARLEEPHGAAMPRMGMHKPVGEAHGDQTAESRNENMLGPKGWQLQYRKHRQAWGFRCTPRGPIKPRGEEGLLLGLLCQWWWL